MESREVLESMRVVDASVTSCGDGSVQLSSSIKVSENLGDDLLEDLDSYLEDINDRLTISRMVSDSVIKGMVNAVAQDAAEKIAAKESEVAGLKESLHLYHVGTDKIESSGSLVTHREPRSTKHGPYSRFPDALVEHDRMAESLGNLRNEAKEQFKKLKKEIDNIRECSSIKRISSGSELLGLGGILQEKVSERWVGVDKTLDTLKTTLDTVYKWVDDLVYLSRASLCEWQQDWEFQGELEAMVIRHSIRSLQEEFEEKLWDHNARFYGSQNWLEKINEISSLRQELDVILKSLSIPEIGQLTSQGSLETVFNRKVLSNPVSSSASLLEGNGKLEESKTTMLENFDSAQLKHMSKDELVNFFKTEMTKMKRNHESTEQEMTEEYFSLKRELFKERASSSALKKDKELDILRKKIPEVILKLDDILVENEKLPAFNNSSGSLGSLKDRLDGLLSENRHLRDLVTDKKKEVKGLSSQVSDAAEKMSLHSLAEANLLKLIGNLKSDIEDAHIEASVSEEVFKCVFREVAGQIKCDSEEPDMESIIMQEIYGIIFREAVHNAEATIKWEIKDLDMEFIIMQGLCEVIFREAVKDAEAELNILKAKYMNENEIRVSLETKALETEKTLRQEVKEKERLKQATLSMAASMEEKEKLAVELTNALVKEGERFELASQDLNNLRDRASQQDILIRALTQEQQNTLLLVEAKEREHSKQMDSIIILVHGQSKAVADFKCRVTEDIKGNSLRLDNLSSQLSSLIQKANILRRTGLQYKQRLERRYSDLQKAEAEVDLLGDEVDTLLSLLEKIYIALDHYSPILQHYPGIIEILKLVRRELSGESTKPV